MNLELIKNSLNSTYSVPVLRAVIMVPSGVVMGVNKTGINNDKIVQIRKPSIHIISSITQEIYIKCLHPTLS